MKTITVIDCGVEPRAMEQVLRAYHSQNKCQFVMRPSMYRRMRYERNVVARPLTRIGEEQSESWKVTQHAASFVWSTDLVWIVTSRESLKLSANALEVVMRHGRPFQVFVFGDTQDLDNFFEITGTVKTKYLS